MRSVNVRLENARQTGVNVQVAQRAVDITVDWVDDAGVAHTDTRTALFPNLLANPALPAGWLQDQLQDLLLKAVRVIVGIDQP